MSKWKPEPGYWSRRGLPEPIEEFRFCNRLWRFDFCWDAAFKECEGVKPGTQVALEIEGGIFSFGGHTRGAYFMKESAKLNEATRLGWRIYKFTPEQMKRDMEIERYPPTYKGKREKVSEFLRSILKLEALT